MLIDEFSDDRVRVVGRNGTDSPLVYWFSYRTGSSSFVTVGTLTAYGFVETVERNGVALLSDPQVRSAVMNRVAQLRASKKYPMPKRGAPRYILKRCPFPETFAKKYKAMERAHFIGNQNLRVSMQTGQIVFTNSSHGKFLSYENDEIGYQQLMSAGVDLNGSDKPIRTKPARMAKPIVVRLSPDTPSFYF